VILYLEHKPELMLKIYLRLRLILVVKIVG